MIGNRIIVLVFLNIVFIFSSNIDFNLRNVGFNNPRYFFHFESYTITWVIVISNKFCLKPEECLNSVQLIITRPFSIMFFLTYIYVWHVYVICILKLLKFALWYPNWPLTCLNTYQVAPSGHTDWIDLKLFLSCSFSKYVWALNWIIWVLLQLPNWETHFVLQISQPPEIAQK